MEIVTRIDTGHPLERLTCHPSLPLIAGWDADRPAIRIWDHADGQLTEIDQIGADLSRMLEAAWHPREPLLATSSGNGVAAWTPGGIAAMPGVPPITGTTSTADFTLVAATSDEILLLSPAAPAPRTPPATATVAPQAPSSVVAEFLAGTVHGDDFNPVGNRGTPWTRISTTGKILPLQLRTSSPGVRVPTPVSESCSGRRAEPCRTSTMRLLRPAHRT